MKKLLWLFFMLTFWIQAQAAVKSCDELKEEIAARIESNGVQNYTLKIVPIDVQEAGSEVGTCAGGTMKIIYLRG